MLHELIRTWFGWVEAWGYFGIILLMALESSVIPVPSEIVVPPAAFWAVQGRFSMAGVILAATLGSYIGSAISYWVSQWVGRPLIHRYGKFVLIPPSKLEAAEHWLKSYEIIGVFYARFLPVIRHLISIPAGIVRMPFLAFSASTALGAGLWCAILAWFGEEVIGPHPELLQSPELMMAAMKEKLHWIVLGVVVMAALTMLVSKLSGRKGKPSGAA